MNTTSSAAVEQAIAQACDRYFAECRRRVPGFINRHFRYPGAWHTNKHAWGWDLLRAPFNLFWAPFYVSLMLLAWLCRCCGFVWLNRLLKKTPTGFTTRVQRHVSQLIYTDLLGRRAQRDRLEETIVASLQALADPALDHRRLSQSLSEVVHQAMREYTLTRSASADIANSVMVTLVGAFTFKKFTPGGMAIGFTIAGYAAHHLAVEQFWLGDFLGSAYYALFPPEPSWQITSISTLLVLSLLTMLASFSGLLTDPIQSWLGIHRRRLNKMLKHLQHDFQHQFDNSFHPKDQYVARILEILDAAKSVI